MSTAKEGTPYDSRQRTRGPLEEALQAFVRDVGTEFNKVYNAQIKG
jgi:hypothetical protein